MIFVSIAISSEIRLIMINTSQKSAHLHIHSTMHDNSKIPYFSSIFFKLHGFVRLLDNGEMHAVAYVMLMLSGAFKSVKNEMFTHTLSAFVSVKYADSSDFFFRFFFLLILVFFKNL